MTGQSIEIGSFVGAVRSVWAVEGPGRLRDSLAAAMRDAIDAGRCPPGGKLPPERRLADQLGVSRATVVAAYGALVRSGLLTRRPRSGTCVSVSRSHRPWRPVRGPADTPSVR